MIIDVAGTTTRDCVRATGIDAFSYNYRARVLEEACFDRSQTSHAVSLCDMRAKYVDVVRAAKVLTYIDGLPEGIFKNLPLGKPR